MVLHYSKENLIKIRYTNLNLKFFAVMEMGFLKKWGSFCLFCGEKQHFLEIYSKSATVNAQH